MSKSVVKEQGADTLGGTQKTWNYLLEGSPLVVQASLAKLVF